MVELYLMLLLGFIYIGVIVYIILNPPELKDDDDDDNTPPWTQFPPW